MKTYNEVKKDLIHPWEKSMRFVNILIFICVLVGSIIMLVNLLVSGNLENIADNESFKVAIGIFSLIGLVIVALARHYANTRAYSILITEKQFPEVHDIIKKFSERLEMGYVPEAYIIQKGGVLNAFAASFFSRRYICIHSDLFEVSYLEHKDLDTLSLIIGHELAHLKRKHSTTVMVIIENIANLIPVWGPAQSRAKEYTCDRHGAWLCPEGVDGLILLSAGKHLYKEIDIEDYLNTSEKYAKGLFYGFVNLMASHPVMPKRIKAIKNLDKHGEVF